MELVEVLKVVAGVISAITGLISVGIKAYETWMKQRANKNKYFWIFLGIAFLSLILFLYLTISNPCSDPAKYGFEDGEMGWVPQTYTGNLGIVSAVQSTDRAKTCKHSLRLTIDLDGAHPNKGKGEVFIETSPQNLENKTISVWIYIPKDAIGSQNKPNGVQLFVKDKELRSEYGVWWDIIPSRVGSWQQLTFTPSSSPSEGVYVEEGFDPTAIRIIGVKIAIGDGSVDKYQGSIYIDSIDWP